MQALITAILYIVVQKSSARVLIIVPPNVLENWMDEIAKWLAMFTGKKADRLDREWLKLVCFLYFAACVAAHCLSYCCITRIHTDVPLYLLQFKVVLILRSFHRW